MRRVHADDILSQRKDSGRLFIFGHNGAEVRHGLAVVLSVGNGCQGVGAAVILGNGDDVGPFFRVGIDAHCGGDLTCDLMWYGVLLEFGWRKGWYHVKEMRFWFSKLQIRSDLLISIGLVIDKEGFA